MNNTNSDEKKAGRLVRSRSIAGLILVILASLGVVLSLVGTWVRSTVLETDSFMEVVEPVLASEEVVTVLGDVISEQVVIALGLEDRVETRLAAVDAFLAEGLVDALDLPAATKALLRRSDLPRLSNLAGAIAEPIERRIAEAVETLVASDGFQEKLPEAVAFAHRGAVALIRQDVEELDNVSIVRGEVRWNIVPLVQTAISHVIDGGLLEGLLEPLQLSGATYVGRQEDAIASLGEALATVLPDDFGQVTVMSEERLESWQSIGRILDRVALLTIVATVVLAGFALWVSRDKRRTLVQLAAGSVIALVMSAIVQRNVLQSLDETIPGPPAQAAAEVLFNAVVANLRAITLIFIGVALVVGVSAYVTGRPAWIEALRPPGSADSASLLGRLDAAAVEHRDGMMLGGVAAAVAIWWWLGINLATLLIVGAALGALLWYITRAGARGDIAETV